MFNTPQAKQENILADQVVLIMIPINCVHNSSSSF